MPDHAAKEFVEQATQSLQSGQFQQALEFAQSALALDPSDAEAHLLRAIALSQMNQPREATDAFQQSIALDGGNAKAHYNLAVHEYGQGAKNAALVSARRAIEIDPSHASARDLVLRLERELGLVPSEGVTPGPAPAGMSVPPPPGAYRPGYEQPLHSLTFVMNMGKLWDIIGWVLAIGITVHTAWFWIFHGQDFFKLFQVAMSDPQAAQKFQQSISNPVSTILSYVMSIGSLLWMIFEMVDRRGPWLWVLPYAICCCCGLEGMTIGVYLLAGRSK